MKLGKENEIEDLEFESDSDEAGSDLDMSQLPEDREAEDSDEVVFRLIQRSKTRLGIASGPSDWLDPARYNCKHSDSETAGEN